jgi:hypothetical protein
MSWQALLIPVLDRLVTSGIEYYKSPPTTTVQGELAPEAKPPSLVLLASARYSSGEDLEVLKALVRQALTTVEGLEIVTLELEKTTDVSDS